jgi:hypothetical protein
MGWFWGPILVLKLKIGPHVQLELVLVALSDIFPMHPMLCCHYVQQGWAQDHQLLVHCWVPKKGVSLQAVSSASKSRVCPWKHFLHLTVRFFPHGSSNLSTHGKFKTNFLSDSLTIPKLISCPILIPSHCELNSNIIIWPMCDQTTLVCSSVCWEGHLLSSHTKLCLFQK